MRQRLLTKSHLFTGGAALLECGLLAAALLLCVAGFDAPCAEQLVSGSCRTDSECFGSTSICLDGRCACPIGLEWVHAKDGSKVCRAAPKNEGAKCQSACQPPLLCSGGKCSCDGGTVLRNGTCVVDCPPGKHIVGLECRRVSPMWRQCTSDLDCRGAFTRCRRYASGRQTGRCECERGTRYNQREGTCVPVCPNGRPPGKVCRRLFINDIDMLSHRSTMDSCPSDQYCATYGKELGHCCGLYCPYGRPAIEFTCDQDSYYASCGSLPTHYCHRVGVPGGVKAVCCPKPCNEPHPIYYDGGCHSVSHLEEKCNFDAQCEGGAHMRCASGRCRCRDGFEPTVAQFPTCVRRCLPQDVPTAGGCLQPSSFGERCSDSRQCGQNGRCYLGVCECACGTSLQNLFGKSVCGAPRARGTLFDIFQQGFTFL